TRTFVRAALLLCMRRTHTSHMSGSHIVRQRRGFKIYLTALGLHAIFHEWRNACENHLARYSVAQRDRASACSRGRTSTPAMVTWATIRWQQLRKNCKPQVEAS